TRSGKGERIRLPARLADDGDLRDVVAVPVHEIKVAPIGAPLPALEVFEDGEDARLHPGADVADRLVLRAAEFGTLQSAADAQHVDVVGFALDVCRHGGVRVAWVCLPEE